MERYPLAEVATVNSPDITNFGLEDNFEEWSECVDCTRKTIKELSEKYA
jgi:hypothetical protein